MLQRKHACTFQLSACDGHACLLPEQVDTRGMILYDEKPVSASELRRLQGVHDAAACANQLARQPPRQSSQDLCKVHSLKPAAPCLHAS